MDARDLFLEQHAAVHTAAVGGNKMSAAERTFAGLTDEQMRVRPREDLNSMAWLGAAHRPRGGHPGRPGRRRRHHSSSTRGGRSGST